MISLVIPYRNYDLDPFRLNVKSLEWQTRPFDEIIVADFASDDPYGSEMEKICEEEGFRYIYTDIDLDHPERDKIIGCHLWQINYNIGIREARGDFILMAGTDRVFSKCLGDVFYEKWLQARNQDKKDVVINAAGWKLTREPEWWEFVNNHVSLVNEAYCRGSAAAMGASAHWLHHVRGVDESLRWYADNDLFGRARKSKTPIWWVNRNHKPEDEVQLFHLATHKGSRRSFGGLDVLEVTRRGKRFIHRNNRPEDYIRNDDTWGTVTEEKIERAIKRLSFTKAEYRKSAKLWDSNPQRWYREYWSW